MVTCMVIARQRTGKHIPATHEHATIGRLLLGNGVVKTSSAMPAVFREVRAKWS
jgi:hypothetical protein